MNILINIVHFMILLFVYIHINHQFKKSNDLEIFEVYNTTKDNYEEICNIKQPIILESPMFDSLDIYRDNIEKNYGVFDVNIRNDDFYSVEEKMKNLKNLKKDYLCENNEKFLNETGLIKELRQRDNFIRPYLVGSCKYDLILGSENMWTPLKYEMNDRTIFIVTEGEITIKLTPPISSRFLREDCDYEHYEFKSPYNPWNIQEEYKEFFEKVKFLEFTIKKGQILYIPSFWWYSIKLNEQVTCIKFSYQTIVNMISMSPFVVKHLLQKQNIKHKTLTKLNVSPEEV